jgi:hypothetical protein
MPAALRLACAGWLAAAAALWSVSVHAGIVVLGAAQWREAGTAAAWSRLEPLARTVEAFDAGAGARILVRYPGGDAGNVWARQVRDRLVAMGIASRHIELQPGSGYADSLVLETVASR